MTTSIASIERSRARRAAARTATNRAARTFQDAGLDTFALLADHAGAGGTDRVVVLHATMALTPDADCEHDEFEELLGATYASSQGQLRLSATEGPPWLWAETVEAWDDLRTALMQSYCCYVPLSLVVDLSHRLVAGYGQFFCPDQGAVPDVILECESAADVDNDPFTALLGAGNASGVDPDERLGDLIARFGLTPPTEPAHEPGDCNLDQPGDA